MMQAITDAHPFLAETCRVLSGVLGDLGQDDESIALVEEALRVQR